MEPILQEIMKVEAVPECFCGFETRRLFLCADAEIVETAWDWKEINKQQERYLADSSNRVAAIKKANDLGQLASHARRERRAYEDAFLFDPLLPATLLPKMYLGREIHDHHQSFRNRLREKFSALVPQNQFTAK
jgi:DNA-binding transcriptional regulator PaaX